MRVTVLTGADGAPFVRALSDLLDDDDELIVVVPVSRDSWTHGLKRCPDLDGLLAAFDDGAPETSAVSQRLADFALFSATRSSGDRAIAAQLVRTELLQAGYGLSDVTTAMVTRLGLPLRLVPVSDDRVEQHVVVSADGGARAVHIDDHLAAPAAASGMLLVADGWSATDAAVEAVSTSDVVVLGPSSPLLALGPLLESPTLHRAVSQHPQVLRVEAPETAPPALAAVAPVELPASTMVGSAVDVLAQARSAS